MKTWHYLESPADGKDAITHTITEAEILSIYWDYWVDQMLKVHKLPMITPQNCIDDFVVVHWAWSA